MRSLQPRHAVRQLCVALLLLAPAGVRGQSPSPPADGGATTIVVVRHTEKASDDPRDPSLSPAGERRAAALASALADARVDAIYVTQFRRTRATAEPLARAAAVPISERPITPANAATHAGNLAREILARHAGETVLVVGHSNTVPEMVRALGGRTVEPLGDEDYDRLFVVVVPRSGPARLFKTRFGEAAAAASPKG